MNPSILVLLLHIGSVIKTIGDLEKGIAHVIQGKASPQDLKDVLSDFADLISGGVIKIPGITQEQTQAILVDIGKIIGPTSPTPA